MNINLMAPINSLGYGIAGLNVSLALNKHANVALFPIGQVDILEEHKEVIEELKANASEYDCGAPCLRIWHQDQLAEFVGKGESYGFPFFELDKFNAREKHHLGNVDCICVASQWAKEIVEKEIGRGDDTYVIPLGVDRTIFNENVQAATINPDFTTFLNVGKWERRKGHDFLIEAFNKAFNPSDKVILEMVPLNPFIGSINDVWAKSYYGSPMGRNIKLHGRLTTQHLLSKVLSSADCGVFPARAEGWNLDLLEMMSMGKQVICTYNTGQTEYVDGNNARLIRTPDLEAAHDGIWFHGQGNWHVLGPDQEEQLIVHMREIHRLKQTSQLEGNQAGIDTAKQFSWDNTAKLLISAMEY